MNNPRWTIEGVLMADSTMEIFPETFPFLTFKPYSMAFHCALGKDWCKNKVKQGLSIYMTTDPEMVEHGNDSLNRVHNSTIQNMSENIPFVTAVGKKIHVKKDIFGIAKCVKQVAKQKGEKPVLIVLDNLIPDYYLPKSRVPSNVKSLIARLDKHLRQPYGCTVLIFQHEGHRFAGVGSDN